MHGFGLDLDLVGQGQQRPFRAVQLGGTERLTSPPAADFGEPRQPSVAALLLRDRVVIWLALAGVTALSWLYVYRQMGAMEGMADIAMPAVFTPWTASDFALNYGDLVGDDAGHDAAQRRTDDPDLCDDQPAASASAASLLFRQWCSPSGYLIAWGLFGALCDLRRLGARTRCPDCADDRKAGPGIGRHRRHCRRHLPAHPIEIGLPDALPLALRLRPQPLAGRRRGRTADGAGARALLSRLLLVFDGDLIRGRHHEPRMDGRDHRLRLRRKAVSGRTVDCARRRRCNAGVRVLPLFFRLDFFRLDLARANPTGAAARGAPPEM